MKRATEQPKALGGKQPPGINPVSYNKIILDILRSYRTQ